MNYKIYLSSLAVIIVALLGGYLFLIMQEETAQPGGVRQGLGNQRTGQRHQQWC